MTLALTALVSSLLVFGVSPVSAHGCTTSDHLAVHGDHYDYWDYTGHRVEIDGNHLHYWRNVTHDYNYISSCGGGGCANPPCPGRVEGAASAYLVAL